MSDQPDMLVTILPQPRQSYTTTNTNSQNHFTPQNVLNSQQLAITKLNANIPPYGSRGHYIPREPKDYGDGGAFPELLFKQYPLDMGRAETLNASSSSKVVALKTDAEGNIQYDAILREGMRTDQILHSNYKDLAPQEDIIEDELMKPSAEAIEEQTAATKAALEKLTNTKLSSSSSRLAATDKSINSKTNAPIFIRYTSGKAYSTGSEAFNSGAKSRMIKLYSMPVDPLEPPKFRHKKLPARPPSPPVPIMHSPPRKVTVEDQKNWKIPPCASNWKNPRGYTLPLHQRLAADGRSLQNHVINDGFARFSEALLIAERQARKEVEARAQMRALMAKKQKADTEKQLAQMAKSVKQKHSQSKPSFHDSDGDGSDGPTRDREVDPYDARRKSRRKPDSDSESDSDSGSSSSIDVDEQHIKAREERDRLRKDRARENKRDYRLSKRKVATGRHRERDISEKIALGQFSGKKSMDSVYDRRLFNHESGLHSGFHADDEYNLYDRPLFNAKSQRIYRPTEMPDYQVYGNESSGKKGAASLEHSDNIVHKSNKMRFEFEKDMDTRNQYTEHEERAIESGSDSESESHGPEATETVEPESKQEPDQLSRTIEKISGTENRKRRLDGRVNSRGYMYATGSSALLHQGRDEAIDHSQVWKRARIAFEPADEENDHVNRNVTGGIQYRKGKPQRDSGRGRREISTSRERERERQRRSGRDERDERERRRERGEDRYRRRDDHDRDRDRYSHRRRSEYENRKPIKHGRDRYHKRRTNHGRDDRDKNRDRDRDRYSDRGRWGD